MGASASFPTLGVLGAGSWGTALAAALARHGREVTLWARDADAAAAMQSTRENARYLPGNRLPDSLSITPDFDRAATAGVVVIATPAAALRATAARLAPLAPKAVVWLCKGFEEGSDRLLHEVMAEALPGVPAAALSGPSFAREVAAGLPCALVCAADDIALADRLAAVFHSEAMRVYASSDLAGVEVCGAIKNVLAVAAGVADGLELGLNARAALITRGLAEMTRLGLALGARTDTFMGLAGVGDLILTCTGDLSRNRRVGLAIGRGEALADAVGALGQVAEGVRSARPARELGRRLGVELPITEAVCRVLFEGVTPRHALAELLARDRAREGFGG
ncbi:NAD(P)H-dependent glycerol-3-phosphate dehydrogenase [Derxia gummosa]|uniref:Glycerol-3-phosphate dehydrogenase [NAD(P)+] n=1 Tax=Derxia gummosa DSM 723 TaxID=1121388 RepID=A0A8B6X5N7_9BURK|nr:NAD(P)H-dependent glycerol-3-phosphate dehydrogenase [Derxia gummosa]